MKLAYDVSRCTGKTNNGFNCVMKNNCLRYLSTILDQKDPNAIYVPYVSAPECIEKTSLECPLKLTAKIYGKDDKEMSGTE